MPIRFSNTPGLVIYFTAGDPDLATTRDMAIAAIDNGANVIELGVPFSDPLADGPVIQRASERAVAKGTRLTDVLGICREIRDARPAAGIILFSYLNPALQFASAHARTTKTSADGEGKYVRVISPSSMYAHVRLRIESNGPGRGFEFIIPSDLAATFDRPSSNQHIGAITAEYIPGIEAGIRDAMRNVTVAGSEMTDVRVTLIGGSSHEIESSEMAFRFAASMAFVDATRKMNHPVRDGQIDMLPFCAAVKEAGADGVLLTDMIFEEAAEYLKAMSTNDLAPVFLAAPTSPDDRLKAIAENSQGFVYAISRVGITGTQTELAADARSLVERLRQFTKLPIALGFGISNAEHVRAVGEFADAAVVGSAIVGLIEKTPADEVVGAVGRFVADLKGGAGQAGGAAKV